MKKFMNKKISLLLVGLLSTTAMMAQEAVEVKKGLSFSAYDALWIIIFLFLTLIVIFLFKILKDISQFETIKDKSTWAKDKPSLWDKFNSFKPMEMEESIDVGHSYDGIRELDNVAPPWFKIGFAITIVFAVVYMYVYHVAKSAPLMIEEYEIAVAKAEAERLAFLEISPVASLDIDNLAMLGPEDIEIGRQLYIRSCGTCHANDGGGGAGPNLTDDYWIHGGSLKDIYVMIRDGYPEKAMPPWSALLSSEQINQVTSFVKSLVGTTPANPKSPQGELYVEESI